MAQPNVEEVLDRTSPARDLVHRRVAALHRELLARDEEMRRQAPDAVHQARVTCRRLRAALGTFGPLLDPAVTGPVRVELRWAARALGDARDAEVVHLRLSSLVDEPDVSVVGPVLLRMERLFRARTESADADVAETIAFPRYSDLLGRLGRLVDRAPWTRAAQAEVGEAVPPLVRRDYGRLERRVARAGAAAAGVGHDVAVHEVRKAAKRLRYACEAVEPAYDDVATRLVEATTRITKALGERQDTVINRRVIRGLAASAAAAGESTSTYDQIEAREEQRARDCEAAFDQAWRDASRPELWAWLA
ncbi:MAG: CHAD domain-containing protein [Nocardioides sp.]